MEKISWYDFSFWGNEKQYVNQALESTWLSGGTFIERFERSLSEQLELPNVMAVANGTAALQLAYLGLGIAPGDEVIVPAFGFMAAANVLKLMHANPVFVDVDPGDWNLDISKVEEKIGPKTKAIVAVHNYGVVADMVQLRKLADKHGIYLIEDCAESVFSQFEGRYCGSFGHVSTFSFHATKTIATGEGGMVSCQSDELADKMRLIRSHGLRREKKHYWHEYYGNNFRLSNILAAIGLGQFEQYSSILAEKERITKRYMDQLGTQPGLRFQEPAQNSGPVFWAVSVYLANNNGKSRDEVMQQLSAAGIECRPGFYTPDQLEIYSNGQERHPVANDLAANIIVLPSYPRLPDEKIDYICKQLLEIISVK